MCVSIAAVKRELLSKFESKASLITRLAIVPDPQVKFQLLRCCASTRPGFWLRTMSPSLTHDASVWFDSQVRSAMSDNVIISTALTDLAWLTSTLPPSCGGLGLTSCIATRHAAHYASWAASWAKMSAMFPAVFSGVDPSSSPLPFAVGLRAAHRRVDSALTALTDNNNDLPLPPFANRLVWQRGR